MTIDKLKSLIEFKECETAYGMKSVHAKLEIHSERAYDPNAVMGPVELIKHIKEELRHSILNHIYEDQRDELANAINELLMASPMDYGEMDKARERIMKAARFQKPSA